MKKLIVAILGLILFFLIINFGPNGVQRRETDWLDKIKKVQTVVAEPEPTIVPTDTTAATVTTEAPVETASNTVASTPAAAALPQIDTDTTSPASPAATAVPPAPAAETAPSSPAPAEAPVAVASPATPAPETAPAPASSAPVEAAVAVPTPATETSPAPATPAPAEAVAVAVPVPMEPAAPAPAPVATALASTPTPGAGVTGSATSSNAPAAAEVPAVASPTTPSGARLKATSPKVMVLAYYRFTEPGSTAAAGPNRISAESFDHQMAWLRDNGFQVLPLSELVNRLKNGTPLPERAVVITINNGFGNAVTVAAPILKKYGYPWSFLIYTDFIQQSPKAVTWSNLEALSKEGVEIGSQSKSHPWLADLDGKTPAQYDKWLNSELTGSRRMLELKLKKPVSVLALPYGNSSTTVIQKAQACGYNVILGMSGDPVATGDSPLNLNRLIVNQFTSPYFEIVLGEKPFRLINPQPASGSRIREARPAFSVSLNYAGKINAKSLHAELSTGGNHKVNYDPVTHTVTFQLPKDLLEGPVIVVIKGRDADTGSPIAAYWQFYYQKPAAL